MERPEDEFQNERNDRIKCRLAYQRTDDYGARAGGRIASQRNRSTTSRVRTRTLVTPKQLGSVGHPFRASWIYGSYTRLAGRSRNRERGERQSGSLCAQNRWTGR